MDINTDFQTALIQQKRNLPKVEENYKNDREAEKAARNFSAVFFSEYVGLMLDEIEEEEGEENFAFNTFKGLQAQALGETLVDSPAGKEMTQMVLNQMHKLQEKVEEGKNDN